MSTPLQSLIGCVFLEELFVSAVCQALDAMHIRKLLLSWSVEPVSCDRLGAERVCLCYCRDHIFNEAEREVRGSFLLYMLVII